MSSLQKTSAKVIAIRMFYTGVATLLANVRVALLQFNWIPLHWPKLIEWNETKVVYSKMSSQCLRCRSREEENNIYLLTLCDRLTVGESAWFMRREVDPRAKFLPLAISLGQCSPESILPRRFEECYQGNPVTFMLEFSCISRSIRQMFSSSFSIATV